MYTQTIKLKDNELPAKVNVETGEVKEITHKKNNLPEGKEIFGKNEIGWRKSFDHSWDFLETVLTDMELRICLKLARMAKLNTNSLEPLSDETTQIEISKLFNMDRRRCDIVFKKLHNLGIYAKFDIVREDISYTKYWILNPYLSFGGKLINSDIANLFKGTKLTNEYYKRLNK